jgi:pimeloyl-ACP methyl ester carboxylesterase
MEFVKFASAKGLKLAGLWYPGKSDVAIICAHGFAGEKTSKGRFTRLGEVLSPLGYNVFAFDFSGCGESDDALVTIEQEVEDFRAAIGYARSRGANRIALVGNSLGSYIALKVYTPEITTMLLLAALTGPTQYDWEAFYTPEQMKEWRETGRVTMVREDPYHRVSVVSAALLEECGNFDQSRLLAAVKCPVLIIHGDGDDEERKLLAQSRKAMERLPQTSRLVVLPGANHRMEGRIDEIVVHATQWFEQHLPANVGTTT